MTNDEANADMPWLQDFPGDIFTKLSMENRLMSQIETMFDVV